MAVFISYRKGDTRAWAIAVHDRLVRTFGEHQVFMDADSLETGLWRPQLAQALDRSSIVLVLIGPRWTTAIDAEGRKRLFVPDDVHRLEITSALRRHDVVVIPILVDGARIPGLDELPDELRPLLERQISEIGDTRSRREADLRKLIRVIDDLTGQRRERRLAMTILATTIVMATVNTALATESWRIAVLFVVASAFLTVFAVGLYRRMARKSVRRAWVALLAAILSAAMFAGSLVRLRTATSPDSQSFSNGAA